MEKIWITLLCWHCNCQLGNRQPFFLSIYELNESSRKEISADLTITFLLRYKHTRRNCVIECLFNCSFGFGFCQGSLLPILFSHHYSIINLVCSKTVVLLTFQISSEFEINYSHPLSHTRSNSSNLAVSHIGWANAQPAHAQLARMLPSCATCRFSGHVTVLDGKTPF